MARSKIPDPLERRHLLERKLDPKQAARIADAYLEADRAVEALAFLARADDTERLEALGEKAIEEGDAFLFRQASTALGREPSLEDWERLAQRAESQGRLRYAVTARRQIDRGQA